MSILNIGTRALLANQLALQVAGNNIANVNTPGLFEADRRAGERGWRVHRCRLLRQRRGNHHGSA
jgi:flagellar basal body rod protein FlgC